MISGQDYQRTDHGKFSLKYEGTKLWNTLPENLKKCDGYTRMLQINTT